MDSCIFCKIIKGEIPSYKTYEDDDVFVMLDINPFSKGHTLIFPKQHFENIYDIPEELFSKVMLKSKRVAEILKERLNCEGVILQQNSGQKAGQSVFHLHVHLKPVFNETEVPSEKHLRKKPTEKEFENLQNQLLLKEL